MPLWLAGCSTPQRPVAQLAPPVKSSVQVSLQPEPVQAQPTQFHQNHQTRVAQVQMQRDYGFMTPLPSTGRVTVRGSIRTVQPEQLISDCPTDSAPYALAESTHYRVQICSEEYDPWLPKYYIGQAKDGSGELRITSTDIDTARQLIFENAGYTYVIYRDGARPDQMNAYLEIYSPTGRGYAEALWYLYEAESP